MNGLIKSTFTASLDSAKQRAQSVANSGQPYKEFVELVRRVYPWRFEKLPPGVLDRDYLRVVDHHLEHLVPRVMRYMGTDTRQVLDFGCGSGGSAIALALVYPNVTCTGTDIDLEEVKMARERAVLYGVADRCNFHCTPAGESLPFQDASFDFCLCSSVLEYAVDVYARRFCIQEMARLLRPQGLLFCSVPNRLYPFEIHTRKWGWNYFPKLLRARTVDCTAWEVKRLARPWVLKLYRSTWMELLRPWSNFCLRRETATLVATNANTAGSPAPFGISNNISHRSLRMNKISAFLKRLSEEPPFRLFSKAAVNKFAKSVRTRARWDVASRPQYLVGVLAAADQALQEGITEISAFEFGVASGNGLLALGDIAAEVEKETRVRIAVYGFDCGTGLPELTGDYRDHPDQWQPGDYPMAEDALRRKLRKNTTLIIGNISDTLPKHIPNIRETIGFVAVDVDAYSSTCDVLRMFLNPNRRMLRRVFMYFDDIDWIFNHRFAGELLAMQEFNSSSDTVKIDRWRGVARQRPFPEESWLNRMHIAHDLAGISNVRTNRPTKITPT